MHPVARGGTPGAWPRPSLAARARILAPVILLITLAVTAPASADSAADTTSTPTHENCYVTGADLATWRSSPDLVIVDTRAEDDFRRVRIPGSINIQPYALRTKTYLEQKRLLLVHRGGTGTHLVPVCRALRDAGFASVGILEGGLRIWSQRVGPLAGDRIAERALSRMSPAEVTREVRAARWLIVDISPGDARVDLGLPTLSIPFRGARSFRAALQDALREHGADGSDTFVLVTDEDGQGYGAIEGDATQVGIGHLYFLDGGSQGYRQYRAEQGKIVDAAERGCTLNSCAGR